MFSSTQRPAVGLSAVLKRFTYANVTATLALFVALSGGAYAAVKLRPTVSARFSSRTTQ